ncbi:MAG: hypothetical protein K2Q25_02890 [Mycobacteriaceae bacterium]|nr:hypothetical protein [Mycobacteriaceae bacterium]
MTHWFSNGSLTRIEKFDKLNGFVPKNGIFEEIRYGNETVTRESIIAAPKNSGIDAFLDRQLEKKTYEWEHFGKSEAAKRPWAIYICIGLFLIVAIIMLFLFVPSSPANVLGDKNSRKSSPGKEGPTAEKAFAISGGHFQRIYEMLQEIGLGDGWAGDSSTFYSTNNNGFTNLVDLLVAVSQGVDATVQTEGAQVNAGKETLANAFGGLQLAMPVSESLYFSGPAGPAISTNFQLVVANSAIGTGTDTANTMHESSRKHGERLAALARLYDEALRIVSSADSVASIRREYLGSGSSTLAATVSMFHELNVSTMSKESGRPGLSVARVRHRTPVGALFGLLTAPLARRNARPGAPAQAAPAPGVDEKE